MELVYTQQQTVLDRNPIIFNNKFQNNNRNYYHDNESGVITLSPVINNPMCQRFAQYELIFVGNIAIPEGGTVGEIGVVFTEAGESALETRARYVPAAVDTFGNVTAMLVTRVPYQCGCRNVSIEVIAAAAGESVLVSEANLSIKRVA